MVICNHPDFDYKQACFDAYNLWIAEYCGGAPRPAASASARPRCARSRTASRDLRRIKALGLRGVMMPGNPAVGGLRPTRLRPASARPRWTWGCRCPSTSSPADDAMDRAHARPQAQRRSSPIIRGCQDILGTFVLGGVFERHPQLRVVCVRGGRRLGAALHVPDGPRLRPPPLLAARGRRSRMPSEYFRRERLHHLPGRLGGLPGQGPHATSHRLLWANDFPHSDSTWPRSQELLAKHAAHLTPAERGTCSSTTMWPSSTDSTEPSGRRGER